MIKAQKKKKGCHRISNEHRRKCITSREKGPKAGFVGLPSSEHEYVMFINHLLVCNIQDLMRMKERKKIYFMKIGIDRKYC